ncbi:MAG: c-type cytochrome [Candidatus Acidiferrales bacterium]
MRGFLFGVLVTLLIIFFGGYFLLKQGYINFSADQESSPAERHLAMSAVDASTDRHAPDLKNPVPASESDLAVGAKLYLDHCAGCHGVRSNPDAQFGRSFNPPVPQFFKEAPDMPENQNFYIVQHGIRWSGMPAWNKTLNDTQIWQLVTFMSNIEKLPPAALKLFEASSRASSEVPESTGAAPAKR